LLGNVLEATGFAIATTIPEGWPSDHAYRKLMHAQRAAGDVMSRDAAAKQAQSASSGRDRPRLWRVAMSRCMHASHEWQLAVGQYIMHT
jgi:hypothetical protein